MARKLTEEQLGALLEAGIAEFAAHGPDRANINAVARKAGVSVGALYKYFSSKDGFFQACLERSLDVLETTLVEVTATGGSLLTQAEAVIDAIQRHAWTHGDYRRLYLRLTVEGGARACRLAQEIEGVTARLYPRFLADAQAEGHIRQDAAPDFFAFFFDNLLMMLQFSCCCDYYKERFRLFCGADIAQQREVVSAELLKFLESAFTAPRADSARAANHRGKD